MTPEPIDFSALMLRNKDTVSLLNGEKHSRQNVAAVWHLINQNECFFICLAEVEVVEADE